ncbi:MAG: M20/M25/M40 family metallo-hydrolase [Acidobacteria bacterium]|nr:M20/M25/M40 family metallo-hydrolase [Acidobacteriota bacterium]MCB9398390.1 M20/M25/M40 family metallo-hydrolase [Acidobacteriota bacterium]
MSVYELAVQMINTPSLSGQEGPMADFLQAYLEPKGWVVERQTFSPGRDNIFAYRHNRYPRLLFNSHIDTVPPYFPARREGDWLYGRGACDTKSLIAAQLLAAQDLIDQGFEDVGLLYVVGEEVDHCGMIKANALGLNPEVMIVGEPTESKLASRQKGILKLRLSASGIAAHSGYPHTGKSAIDPLIDVLYDLRHHTWPAAPDLGATTLNIGLLGGGKAANVIPDSAFAEVMIRVVTSHHDILKQVEKLVANRVEFKVVAANDPTDLAQHEHFESCVVAFNTDIPYFRFDGKAFLYGPGSILDAHTAGEKIRIQDLEKAVHTYAELARLTLGLA